MKAPDRIFIHGTEWSVEYIVIEGQGETYFEDQIIYINPKYPERYQKVTLVHEIMHVLLHQKNSYLPETFKHVDDNDLREHLIINTFDWPLYEVLESNPILRGWLWNE